MTGIPINTPRSHTSVSNKRRKGEPSNKSKEKVSDSWVRKLFRVFHLTNIPKDRVLDAYRAAGGRGKQTTEPYLNDTLGVKTIGASRVKLSREQIKHLEDGQERARKAAYKPVPQAASSEPQEEKVPGKRKLSQESEQRFSGDSEGGHPSVSKFIAALAEKHGYTEEQLTHIVQRSSISNDSFISYLTDKSKRRSHQQSAVLPHGRELQGSLISLLQDPAEANLAHSVQALLEDGGNVHDVDPVDSSTALHFAVRQGLEDVVGILLWHGADPNAKNSRGNDPYEDARKQHNHMLATDVTLGCKIGRCRYNLKHGTFGFHTKAELLKVCNTLDPHQARCKQREQAVRREKHALEERDQGAKSPVQTSVDVQGDPTSTQCQQPLKVSSDPRIITQSDSIAPHAMPKVDIFSDSRNDSGCFEIPNPSSSAANPGEASPTVGHAQQVEYPSTSKWNAFETLQYDNPHLTTSSGPSNTTGLQQELAMQPDPQISTLRTADSQPQYPVRQTLQSSTVDVCNDMSERTVPISDDFHRYPNLAMVPSLATGLQEALPMQPDPQTSIVRRADTQLQYPVTQTPQLDMQRQWEAQWIPITYPNAFCVPHQTEKQQYMTPCSYQGPQNPYQPPGFPQPQQPTFPNPPFSGYNDPSSSSTLFYQPTIDRNPFQPNDENQKIWWSCKHNKPQNLNESYCIFCPALSNMP